MKMARLGSTKHARPLPPRDQYGGRRGSARALNWDYSTAMGNQFSLTGQRRTKDLEYKMQIFINICFRQILHMRWLERIYNQVLLRKIRQGPISLPSRTEGGNESYLPYAESKAASLAKPWIGREPSGETKRRRAKDHPACRLTDRRRRRQMEVRIQGPSSRGNEEEYVSYGDSWFIECQNVFICYNTNKYLFINTCLFRVWVANQNA